MLTSYRVTRGFWNYLEGLNIISLSGTNVSLVAKERAMINYMSRNKDLFSKSVIKNGTFHMWLITQKNTFLSPMIKFGPFG